jgi:preprotein translocase subunit SecA
LAVIGTERHESRRIDNQLRGRAGRQGDPGISQFFVSMEDDLMRIFGGERLKGLMDRLGLPDNEPIQHSMISGSIEQAQRRVEGHNFDIRKHLVEYDDVMNQHREVVYRKRHRILGSNPEKDEWLHDEVRGLLHDDELVAFDAKVAEVTLISFRQLERILYLRTIDTYWIEHLMTMQHLREGIGLKGYAQRDPLVEYKEAAYGLFQELKDEIENQVVDMLLKAEKAPTIESSAPVVTPAKTLLLQGADEQLSGGGFKAAKQLAVVAEPVQNSTPVAQPAQSQPATTTASAVKQDAGITVTVRSKGVTSAQESVGYNPYTNVGRNDQCPCGSGKKFKKCHGA